jgi:hypothetical protein
MTQEFSAILVAASVVCSLLQWAKKGSWFPWLTGETERLNRYVAAVIAAGVGLGIGAHYDPATGSLLVTGLTKAGLLQGVGHVIGQWMAQQGWYRVVIAPPANSQTLDLLKDLVQQIAAGAKGTPPALPPAPQETNATWSLLGSDRRPPR